MVDGSLSRAKVARRMESIRSQLERILDPKNESLTLAKLPSAAAAIGCELPLELA